MDNIYVNTEHFNPVHPGPAAQQTGPGRSRGTVWAAVLCLVLLSVALLAGLIGLGVIYHRSSANLRASGEERDRLNSSLSAMTAELQYLTGRKRICPAGWRMSCCGCYLLSDKVDTWDKAREDCRRRRADLVVIQSRDEQAFLSALAEEDAWIGLTDRGKEGHWKWIDGTVPLVRFWKRGQPDQGDGRLFLGDEDCAHIETGNIPDGNWNDRRCDHRLHWICEKLA